MNQEHKTKYFYLLGYSASVYETPKKGNRPRQVRGEGVGGMVYLMCNLFVFTAMKEIYCRYCRMYLLFYIESIFNSAYSDIRQNIYYYHHPHHYLLQLLNFFVPGESR